MKNQEPRSLEAKKEEEKFVPYVLTKEQRDTNPNGLWEKFLDGTITTIKNSVSGQDSEEGTVRAKLAKAIKEDLSEERQKLITVDDILFIGLQNFKHEHGGTWGKEGKKWKDIYNVFGKKERESIISEIEKGFLEKDWDSVGDYIEESIENVPGLDSTEYDALREELWKKFNEIQQREY